MFLGTTTAALRNYIAREIQIKQPQRVVVPCAGNFAIEQIAGSISKEIKIISGDVSEYSVAIGHGLLGADGGIIPKPLMHQEFPFLASRSGPYDRVACMLIMSEAIIAYNKRNILYYKNLYRQLQGEEEYIFEKIMQNVDKFRGNVENMEFYGQDASETVSMVKSGDLVFYDPPFFLDGYEKMFKGIGDFYDFPKIEYGDMNAEIKAAHLSEMNSREATVYYRPEFKQDIPNYELAYQYNYKQGKNYYIYCNSPEEIGHGKAEFLRESAKNYDVLYIDDEINIKSKVRLLPFDTNTANHYRILWTKKASVKSAGFSYGVFIDEKLSGVISIMDGMAFGSTYARIFADACPLHTKYKRLSKLIINIILSEEFLKMVNDKTMYGHEGFTTKAYTNKSSSMKYRNDFELAEKKPDDGDYEWALTYRTKKMRNKTIKDAYRRWFQKFGGDING